MKFCLTRQHQAGTSNIQHPDKLPFDFMQDQTLNHRTITGRKKSLATRNALLAATLRVIGSATIRFPSIGDVIKEAGVARGTFYKHFSSLDEAVEAVSLRLAEEWAQGFRTRMSSLVDQFA